MTKGKSRRLNDILMWSGILLILSAVIMTSVSFLSQRRSANRASEIAERLRTLMPEPQSSYPDGRSNTSMSAIEIDGENFIGLIEIPLYDCTLPVYASWEQGRADDFPCRYTGSVYDRTLIIGGSNAVGQLDLTKTITEHDRVFFTDTEGMRYSYKVSGIEITDDVSAEKLISIDADLVIFVRDTYSFNYTVIKCNIA